MFATVRKLTVQDNDVLLRAMESPSFSNVDTVCVKIEFRPFGVLNRHVPHFEKVRAFEITTRSLRPDLLESFLTRFTSLRSLSITWTDDTSWDGALRPTDRDVILRLFDQFIRYERVALRMTERSSVFTMNIFELLPRVPTVVQRLEVSSGAEGFILSREEEGEGEGKGWALTVEPIAKDFDAARVRLLLAALPPDLPITRA